MSTSDHPIFHWIDDFPASVDDNTAHPASQEQLLSGVMPEVPTKTLGIVEAVLAQIDETAKDITEPNLNELTVEKLKSILKTSGSFVSGNKPVLVARIFAEVEATKWKQESFLKYPE